MELIEKTDPESPFLADMREAGNLPLDFQAIYDLTVEMANSDESKELFFSQSIRRLFEISSDKWIYYLKV